MAANGISTLETKEERQIAKLELAQTKRQQTGTSAYRNLRYYDRDLLPTKYVGNNVVSNPHPDGLVVGRPWKTTPNTTLGLWRSVYNGNFDGDWTWFDSQTPASEGAVTDFGITDVIGDNTSIQWLGYFKAPQTANYIFWLYSDDTSILWIGDKAITGYNDGNWDVYTNAGDGEASTDTIGLVAGQYYPIRVQYGNGVGSAYLDVSWESDGPSYTMNIRSWDAGTSTPGDIITTCNEGDTIYIEADWANLVVPGGPDSYLALGGVQITNQDLGVFGPQAPLDQIPFGADAPISGPTGALLLVTADNTLEGDETLTWSWYVNGAVVASTSCTIVDTSTGL